MTTKALAAQYIREQIEIMKKHGDAPKLNSEATREAIADAQKTFEVMQQCASERATTVKV